MALSCRSCASYFFLHCTSLKNSSPYTQATVKESHVLPALRIGTTSRASRFIEPPSTLHSDDDEEFSSGDSDCESDEMELEVEIPSGKTYRNFKKLTRAGSKISDELVIKARTKGSVGRKHHSDFVMLDALKPVRQKKGVTVGSSIKLQLHVPPIPKGEILSRKNWEEQAYQIIRRQKLRDAALTDANARIDSQTQREMADIQNLASPPRLESSKRQKSTKLDGNVEDSKMKDAVFLDMATRLGFEEKWKPLVEYLHGLGLQESDFSKVVDRHKACLQTNVSMVKQRIEYLVSLGVKYEHLRKMIVRHPQIIEYTVDRGLKPRVQFLQSLGLPDLKLGRVITVAPTLLECSLERSLKPRVAYLKDFVGIHSEDISKIVIRSPQILTQSIEDSLEPRVKYFLEEMKFPKESLAKMVTRHPQLLHYSLEDGIRPRVEYLRSIGMSNDDIVKVLTRLVQVLSLSIQHCLKPKYDYLQKELRGTLQTVISYPAYFSLSLEQRIISRHRYLIELQKSPTGPFPMKLLSVSDAVFCAHWAKTSEEEYDRFRHQLLLKSFAKKFEWKHKVQF